MPAIARRCRRGRRSRSRTSARCRRIWRSPRSGRSPIGSSPPCTTAARARVTRACTWRSTIVRPATRRCRSARTSPPTRHSPARRAASAATVTVDDPDGIQADNVRYAVLGGTEPAVGAGRQRRRAISAATRSTCSTRSPRARRPTRRFRCTGVGGAQLSAWSEDRLAPHAAVLLLSTRGLERRGRELLASYARNGGGMLDRRRRRHRRRASSPTCSARDRRCASSPRPATKPRAARAGADRRAASGVSAVCRERGDARPRDVPERGADRRQPPARRWRASPPATRRSIECPSGDGRALVLASDLDNRWNDFPLHATFVPFLHEVVRYLASARAHASDYFVGDAPAGVQAGARHRDARATRRSRAGAAPHRGQRRSARSGSGADVGRGFSVGGDAVEGRRRRRGARRGAAAGGSPASVAVRAGADGGAARGRRICVREA